MSQDKQLVNLGKMYIKVPYTILLTFFCLKFHQKVKVNPKLDVLKTLYNSYF